MKNSKYSFINKKYFKDSNLILNAADYDEICFKAVF